MPALRKLVHFEQANIRVTCTQIICTTDFVSDRDHALGGRGCNSKDRARKFIVFKQQVNTWHGFRKND